MPCQVPVNLSAGQRSLNHRPLPSVVGAAPAEVEQVAVGDDHQARSGERLDAGVVDLYRRGPVQIGVGGEVLLGDGSGLLGHPQR